MATLDDAVEAIRMGDREEGRQILEGLLENDEGNEQVWLWLSTVVDSDEDREVCLENVLALNAANGIAQRGLEALRAGRFNPRDIMSEALGGVEEEEPASGSSFIDEFKRATEPGDEDDELVMPSTMAKAQAKAGAKGSKKQAGGFKLNVRLIILAVLALLIVCALAGVAAYNLFLGGGDTTVAPSGGQPPAAQTPTGGETAPAAPPTQAPTAVPAEPTQPPPPTATPKPKLELPTPKPTDAPTPTATQVVAPTP